MIGLHVITYVTTLQPGYCFCSIDYHCDSNMMGVLSPIGLHHCLKPCYWVFVVFMELRLSQYANYFDPSTEINLECCVWRK